MTVAQQPAAASRSDGDIQADAAIGARLRRARTLAGMSQSALGAKVGVSYQQIQKYEAGLNRIGGSRLVALAAACGVEPTSLLVGDGVTSAQHGASREVLLLVNDYRRIADPEARRALRVLASELAGGRLNASVGQAPIGQTGEAA